MSTNFNIPKEDFSVPCIKVFGVGGGGCNAVNNMIEHNVEGVSFIVANTDAQSLAYSLCESNNRVQLGSSATKGLGAGSIPEVGRTAAEESAEELKAHMKDASMVFITAGMGGGTGTGAAPVITSLARELDILTVGVVTTPFDFEGIRRKRIAMLGIEEMEKYVDTLIVIPNQNLFRIANEATTFKEAFKRADDVLRDGVNGITALMVKPGLINLDFADIKTVMSNMGRAVMGTGEATGENRAIIAAEAAISNPLLDNNSMRGAKGVLINITGGDDMTLFEVDAAVNRIKEEVDGDANIIFGSAFDESLNGSIRISLVATGVSSESLSNNNVFSTLKPLTNNNSFVTNLDEQKNHSTEKESEQQSSVEEKESDHETIQNNNSNMNHATDGMVNNANMGEINNSGVTTKIVSKEVQKNVSSLFSKMANAARLSRKSDSELKDNSSIDVPAFMRRNKDKQ